MKERPDISISLVLFLPTPRNDEAVPETGKNTSQKYQLPTTESIQVGEPPEIGPLCFCSHTAIQGTGELLFPTTSSTATVAATWVASQGLPNCSDRCLACN